MATSPDSVPIRGVDLYQFEKWLTNKNPDEEFAKRQRETLCPWSQYLTDVNGRQITVPGSALIDHGTGDGMNAPDFVQQFVDEVDQDVRYEQHGSGVTVREALEIIQEIKGRIGKKVA